MVKSCIISTHEWPGCPKRTVHYFYLRYTSYLHTYGRIELIPEKNSISQEWKKVSTLIGILIGCNLRGVDSGVHLNTSHASAATLKVLV